MEAFKFRHPDLQSHRLTPRKLVSMPQCRFLLIFESLKDTWASRQEGHKSPTELVLYLLVLPGYLEYFRHLKQHWIPVLTCLS